MTRFGALHVVHIGRRWWIKREGQSRPVGGMAAYFETQADAWDEALYRAEREGVVCYLHSRNGRVRKKHDPHER